MPGKLRVFDPIDQTQLWQYSGPCDLFDHVTAGDLNGDGIDEIVAMSRLCGTQASPAVHAIDGLTYQELPGFPYPLAFTGNNTNTVHLYDLDANGDLEMIFLGDGFLNVLDPMNSGSPSFRANWPRRRGNTAANGDYHWDRGPYPMFTRGDANLDGAVNLGDVVRLGRILFAAEATSCLLAADLGGDESLDLSDLIRLVQFLFAMGPPPEQPYPECVERSRTPLCSVFLCP